MIVGKPFTKKYPQLGEVFFNRKRGIKRLSIRIDGTGKISVNIPFFATFSLAEQFLLAKQDIIVKKKQELQVRSKLKIISETKTRFHELKLVPDLNYNVIKNGYLIELHYPSELPIESSEVQTKATGILEEILRAEAKVILPKRIAEIANNNGFKYNKLTIRNTKSRWGSCSTTNNISLSLHLLKLPDHLVDYIILHELCHTVEKNHKLGFWNLLNSKCDGRAKGLAKEVKQYASTI